MLGRGFGVSNQRVRTLFRAGDVEGCWHGSLSARHPIGPASKKDWPDQTSRTGEDRDVFGLSASRRKRH